MKSNISNQNNWPQLAVGKVPDVIDYTQYWSKEARAEEYRRRGEFMYSKEVLLAERPRRWDVSRIDRQIGRAHV